MTTTISWLFHARVKRREDGALTSNQASIRYRMLTAIRETRGDFTHRLVPVPANPPPQMARDAMAADILLFSKVWYEFEPALARDAQAAGKRVIFDLCDDHFQHPSLGGPYRAMASLADEVVCNTPQMAAAAALYARGAPRVIEDPYEGPRGAARFAPGEVLKLLWFGHPTNLDTLEAALNELTAYAARRPLALTVLTEPGENLAAWSRSIAEASPPGFSMIPKAWSLTAQWEELAACDVVVIPTLDLARKRVKSANRMIEGLWAGRPVVAQPLPAYAPFARWTPVRTTLSEGLDQLFEHRADAARMVAAAQEEIAITYNPARLARDWADLLRTTAASKEPGP